MPEIKDVSKLLWYHIATIPVLQKQRKFERIRGCNYSFAEILCTIKHASKVELKKLFEFATSGTYFLFQGAFYDQIDDVAMGSSLCPVLANLCMSYYEAMWLNTFHECEMILYRRYIDDIMSF